jgi:hypothetical protein
MLRGAKLRLNGRVRLRREDQPPLFLFLEITVLKGRDEERDGVGRILSSLFHRKVSLSLPRKLERFANDFPLLNLIVKDLPEPQQSMGTIRSSEEFELFGFEFDAYSGSIGGIAAPLAKQIVFRAKTANVNPVGPGSASNRSTRSR